MNGSAVVRAFSPAPDVAGLKLDWHSALGASGVMIDWSVVAPGVDDGLPGDVARVLARGLCAVATVAGCAPGVPASVGTDWTRVPGGHAVRLAGGWLARPRAIPVLATQDPHEVAQFFEAGEFVWSLEGQALFLSPPGRTPTLTRALVDGAFVRPLGVTPEALDAAGVTGLLLPGVDGDVAGLYVPDAARRRAVLDGVASAARAAGFRWEERDGAEYALGGAVAG